jgi:hypothetical protein
MAESKNNQYFERLFNGMNRRRDPDKAGQGDCSLAVNVDLSRLGTVRKRKGSILYGQKGNTDDQVQDLIEYKNVLYMVRNGSVYAYNTITSLWEVKNSGIFPSKKQVSSVIYKDRIYYTSPDENLGYITGSGAYTTVGTGVNQIKGRCLGTAQSTLYIGNVTVDNVHYPNRVYFSLYDVDNNTEGDQFWGEDETGLANSTNKIDLPSEVRNITSFPNQNLIFIFTDKQCWAFDIVQAGLNSQGALISVFNIGCCGHRASTVIDGVLYWMDSQGKIWAWTGNSARPEELSYSIDDDNLSESVISQIDRSRDNLSKVHAFGLGRNLYFSVGDIILDGVVMPKACIKFTLSQDGLRSYPSIDTHPDRILCSTITTIDNNRVLVLGDSINVKILNIGLNEVNTNGQPIAISSLYRTKTYDFGMPLNQKTLNEIIIRYRPQQIENCYLDVKLSVNNSIAFQAISKVTDNIAGRGIINMYDPNSNLRHVLKKVSIPPQFKGYTHAIEFSNEELNQSYEVSLFGFENVTIDNPNVPFVN